MYVIYLCTAYPYFAIQCLILVRINSKPTRHSKSPNKRNSADREKSEEESIIKSQSPTNQPVTASPVSTLSTSVSTIEASPISDEPTIYSTREPSTLQPSECSVRKFSLAQVNGETGCTNNGIEGEFQLALLECCEQYFGSFDNCKFVDVCGIYTQQISSASTSPTFLPSMPPNHVALVSSAPILIEPTSQTTVPSPQPITTTPEPITTTPEPIITTPEPVTTTPEPVTTTQEHITTTQEHITNTQEPITTTPEPITTTQQQITTTQQQITTTPEPITTTQQQITATQEPITTTPEKVTTMQETTMFI